MLHLFTLNWQAREKIRALYDSLMPALEGIEHIWHIKDNGSTDGSVEEIRNWNAKTVNLCAYPNNKQSYSQGMNYLYNESQPKPSDTILTLNNDVIMRDNTSIKHMLDILDHDNGVGIVGAKLNYTDTSKIQHCGVLFHRTQLFPFHYRAGVEEAERDSVNRYYPVVTGAVCALKADTYVNCYKNKSGNLGFCEDYFFAFEDVDMCMRIGHHLNKQVVYCGKTNIWHEESASLKKNPVNKMFGSQNHKVFMDNWYKTIDPTLTEKYSDPAYMMYKSK